jgi:murein DD-endopeptidase MepM/ murein hydrolase activator NlpD
MTNDGPHGCTRYRSNIGYRFTHAARYATHSIFLLITMTVTIVATSQVPRLLANSTSKQSDERASMVLLQMDQPDKQSGRARLASLVKYHNEDNVVRRNVVLSGSSLTPSNGLAAPHVLLTYTVQSGDTLFGIAGAFGLAPETVLWSNYRVLKDNPEMLSIGLQLIIPPANGLITEAEIGDTVDIIARRYKVTPQAIITEPLNGLTAVDHMLPTGKQLFVPGGQRELVIWEVPKPVEVRRNVATGVRVYSVGTCGEIAIPPLGTGGFVYPTGRSGLSGYDFTSTHPGLDFAGSLGDNIYAADSGTVIFAGNSLNAVGQYVGYGKYIVIDHGDGYQTLYAHASQSNVTCGQQVLQGSVIGAIGSTGNSTGPHLHFEIRNNRLAVNPWSLLPRR